MQNKKSSIILASDHAGFALKEIVKDYLISEGFQVQDLGAHKYSEGDDYPKLIMPAAMKVAEDISGETKAVIFGGSGQGEAMVANRFPGVRACVWYGGNEEVVGISREHNDSNVLSIGARFADEKTVCHVVERWITTPFSNDERHKRRIEEMDNIE